MDYKKLYEQTLAENKELKKELETYKEYPQQGGWEKALENIEGIKDIVIKENKKFKEECDELIEKLTAKQEELNEESQQKLKNKEGWMSVQKQYHKLKEEVKEYEEEISELKEELKQYKEYYDNLGF
jgi:uncharacterized coiled-coil DUF342 family protein